MPAAQVLRFRDYEQRSREPDAVDRDPSETAVIIILPVVRIERFEPFTHEELWNLYAR